MPVNAKISRHTASLTKWWAWRLWKLWEKDDAMLGASVEGDMGFAGRETGWSTRADMI